ncbi:MAG TPA: acetyl-CoA carboxylase biotin carboxyl carrier protein subunit, partial [Actinoplanes sp.]|nr:acetyl-CoA carboxylase biotin carboxyl carrier protein subunit [Actinoplanes sp.]
RARSATGATAAGDDATLTAPMQGTIVKIAVQNGDTVAAGDLIVALEAMKMEQPVLAHRSGTVTALSVHVGAAVAPGTRICAITQPTEPRHE